MILGDLDTADAADDGRTTLDDVFCRAVARDPFATALTDPPNRVQWTDGAPLRLSYAEADRIVSAIAGRLRRLGLATDAVVGLQLANTVESALTVLGVLRAGMIAAPMPLLWRHADIVAALGRLGAKALITQSRVGGVRPIEVAMQAASELFPVRYVCGFGSPLADGAIPFDDLLTKDEPDPFAPVRREGNPAAHAAVVTFEVTPAGVVAVARNHLELLAGGLAVMLEAELDQQASILSPCNVGSFAGLASTLVPWLLTGGTLSLHHPFDPEAFAAQLHQDRCDTLVLPGPLIPRLADAGLLDRPWVRSVVALWHAPERLASSPPWRHNEVHLTDLRVFGETAVVGTRRGANGWPAPIVGGPQTAPHGAPAGVPTGEIKRTIAGTLAIRGPMVPRHPFPPGAERSALAVFKADAEGFVDTQSPCRSNPDSQVLEIAGPPPGTLNIGSYRFLADAVQDAAMAAGGGSTLAALPDAIFGHRLAGDAADRAAVRHALAARGVNPLIADAFRERQRPDAG